MTEDLARVWFKSAITAARESDLVNPTGLAGLVSLMGATGVTTGTELIMEGSNKSPGAEFDIIVGIGGVVVPVGGGAFVTVVCDNISGGVFDCGGVESRGVAKDTAL